MRGEDYYAILGLSRGASSVQIKKSYRLLVLRFHPDRNPGDKKAEEQFKKIVKAYETLSHPEKRKQYDLTRNAFQEALAQHRTEQAREKARASSPTAQPGPKPAAPRPPPKTKRSERMRGHFDLESNEFDQRDAAVGAGLAILSTAAAGTLHLGTLSLSVIGVMGLTAIVGRYAFQIGAGFAEFLYPRVSPSIESMARLLPCFFSFMACCVVIWLARWTGTPISVTAIGPAGMAAALAAAGGGGLGRAFTSVAAGSAALWIGLGVAALVGGFAGSVLGFAFVSVGIHSLFDPAFYESLFHGALGASIGGASGAVVGALRRRLTFR